MKGAAAGRAPIDSVLLIGFGGPTDPDDVMAFLRRVVRGRGIPDERLRSVAHHYEIVGGRSPYNDLTLSQADALARWLAAAGRPLPVRAGMRNWHPFLADALRRMEAEGLRHAAGVILAPHRSESSWDRYIQDVADARKESGCSLEVSYLEPWFDDPGFLEASAQQLEAVTRHRRGAWPAQVPIVFTAHSIPEPMARRSPYVSDLTASCEGVARLLGVRGREEGGWRLAYQSRSGDGRMPWLEPDILDVLRECAAAGANEVAVQAIGFLIDHVEVLYDLDVEAAQAARDLGMTMRRAPCVNVHPEFVAMLGRRVLGLAAAGA